ncbi:MAG: Do family serine endopeptidase [Opitutaceae bacterium]
MHPRFPRLTLVLVALLTASGVAHPALRAEEKIKTPERTPLTLKADPKAINRDTPERISYAAIVKKTAPSVVYVFTSKKIKTASEASPFFNDPQFRRFFGVPDSGEREERSGRGNRGGRSESPPVQTGLGSGVIISSDGYILTNNHVIDGADEVKVAFGEPRREFKATIIGRDSKADVAVIKIAATDLMPATLGDSDQLEIGDVVLAIGNPFGIGQSVTRGIVSALSRGGLGIETYEDFIQTDAAINPGNSGGALLDVEGRLIGLNTAILSRSGGFNGVGFAIPINQVRTLAEQLVKTGRVERAFLGVQTQPLEAELSAMFKVNQGALIVEVQSDTPADKAGLKSGDIITKIDATTIRDPRHLQLTVTRLIPGTEANVEYLRDGKPGTVKVKLTSLPGQKRSASERSETPEAKDVGVLNGVGVGDISAELREQLNLSRRVEGAIITSIEADSPSARAGLREGDIILELDRRLVRNADEAVKLSEEIKGPKVLVRLWRNGSSRFLVVDESK